LTDHCCSREASVTNRVAVENGLVRFKLNQRAFVKMSTTLYEPTDSKNGVDGTNDTMND
jgi:hypothetical protein